MALLTTSRLAHLALFIVTLFAAFALLGLAARPAQATVYYVTTTGTGTGVSWATAGELQAILTNAHPGDQVWVKKGTYSDGYTGTDGVAVYGGFAGTETSISQRNIAANPTVLDGGSYTTPYTIPDMPPGATGTDILDGFTIQNGYTRFGFGGGVSDQSPVDMLQVANCVFINNSAAEGGGLEAGNIATVTNCTFTSNTASGNGGGLWAEDAIATVSDCTFTGNTASNGGGLDASNATVSDCTFTGNTASSGGGGLNADEAAVSGCTFTNNTASGEVFGDGGGGFSASIARMTNCTFTSNTASTGGGLYFMEAANVDNCTFTSNTASEGGGIGTVDAIFVTVSDCVFSSDTSSAIYADSTGEPSSPTLIEDNLILGTGTSNSNPVDPDGIDIAGISYLTIANNTISNTNVAINDNTVSNLNRSGTVTVANNICYANYGAVNHTGTDTFTSATDDIYGNSGYAYQGVSLGATDISVNPRFVKAATGNYRLATGSPLIDAGTDSFVASGDTDLDGNARINGAHVDLGCYEYIHGMNSLTWTAAALSSGPSGTSRILWNRSDGAAALWALSSTDTEVAIGQTYGPFSGWTATAIATASDGTSRVLWTNTNGEAGLWSFDANGNKTVIGPTYGPYPGWTARAVGVAGDGTSRVLWVNANGMMGLWSFDANDNRTLIGPAYGPYAGWSAVSLATDPTDGTSRALWNRTDGAMGLWSFNASDAETMTGTVYGPYPGWTAQAVGAMDDGTARVLWTNVNEAAGIWSFSASDTEVTVGPTYGPYAGWTASALGVVATDGTARVLWDNASRAAGGWSFGTNDAESLIGPAYGPY